MIDLAELDIKVENNNGKPLELPLADVMEDPSQPRVEFPEFEMNKIAESIKQRGVKTPISVHIHPTETGKYIINHGARRYRGSLLAGKETIPAFIDESHTDYDQVMENKERLGHTPIEIALFIKKKLAEGEKKKDIAKKLNEDAVYVTTHLALIDMPEALTKAYNAGCKSPKTLYDLRNLFDKFPQEVEAWILDLIENEKDIFRSSVQALAKELKKPKKEESLSVPDLQELVKNAENAVIALSENNTDDNEQFSFDSSTDDSAVNTNESALEHELVESEPKPAVEENNAVIANESVLEHELVESEPKPAVEENNAVIANEIKQPKVQVIFDGKDAMLMLFKAPRSRGFAWIEFIANGEQLEVDCSLLEVESVLGG